MKELLKKKLLKAAKEKLYYDDIYLTNFAHSELEKLIDNSLTVISVKEIGSKETLDKCTVNINNLIDFAFGDAQIRKAPMVDILALNNAKRQLVKLWPFF